MLNCLQNQMTAKMTRNYLNSNGLFISLENPEVKSQPTGVSTFAITHELFVYFGVRELRFS